MENACRTEDPAAIKQEAISHFQGILCSDEPLVGRSEYLENLDGFIWSPQHMETLNKAISHEEIKKAIFSIDDSKAPGPGGFSSRFFKAAWSIIGSDVCAAVSSFFESGSMLRKINCTIIALVPKVPNPGSMHDYRPICCCNTIYKCISKIIAARIKWCIPDIISPLQSAFVQGRSIADNVLITQDLMLNYHRDIGPPRCALKVDIKKAYDTISWGCILNILSSMGTPTHLLRCIKACITINGIGLLLIQVTLLLSRTVVPIIISMPLERILSLGLQILLGFSLLAMPGTTLDQRCLLLIGTIRFGFPKPSGGTLLLFGWPYRTDWLPKISFSSGVSPTLCLVYSIELVLKTGTTYSSVANSQLVFGRGF